MEDKNQNIGTIVLIIIFIIGAYLVYNLFTPKWTLMVCATLMPNGVDCSTNTYVNKDAYADLQTCIESGKMNSSAVGFECGKNCKYDDNFWICDEVCNSNGICTQ